MPARTRTRAHARSRAAVLKAVLVAALFLASGPAGLALPGTAGAQASSPSTAVTASALAAAMARNRQAALDEARKLLSLALLPPGAVKVASVPQALAGGPVLGTPVVGSLVVQTRYWRAPMPFDQAQAWLVAHPPKGLRSAGSSNGGGPSATDITAGYGYTAPSTPQIQSAELEMGAAYLGPSSSAFRVDAVVIWTDPRPWLDDAGGPRLHVTVAEGCPATVAGAVGVSNPGAGLTASLLPAGDPTAALVCRYNGSDGLSGTLPTAQWHKLAHQARLGATGARQLALVVAAAPISRTVVPGTEALCPMDDGAVAVLAFSYPGRPDVDLWAQLNGCTLVGNGYILGAGEGIATRAKTYG